MEAHAGLNLFWGIMGLIGQVSIVVLAITYFAFSASRFAAWVKKHGVAFALGIALFATLGSFIYSEIANLPPCKLCWYGRIAIFPQVLILGAAWMRQKKDVFWYSVPLALYGLVVSLYHYITQQAGIETSCSNISGGGSCGTIYMLEFGYISIPFMAIITLLLIILLLMFVKK